MRKTIKKIFYLLDYDDKKKTIIFIFLLLLTTFLETLSLAIVYPLIKILINKSLAINFFNIFEFKIPNAWTLYETSLYLILAIFFFYILKTLYLFFFYFWKSNFIHKLNNKICEKLMIKYLYSPFSFFFYKNSSDFIRSITYDSGHLNTGIDSYIKLFIEILSIIGILLVLFLINPILAIFILFIFSVLSYCFIFFLNKKIHNWAKKKQYYKSSVYKNLQEAFILIREIILKGSQQYFIKKFNTNNSNLNILSRNLMFTSDLPKIILEIITIFIICVLFASYYYFNSNIIDLIPIITVYILAIIRIVPCFSRIINCKQNISASSPSINLLYEEIINLNSKKINKPKNNKKIEFKKEIEIKNLFYKYPNKNNYIFKNLNFTIKKNSLVFFVGPSGIGKSTLADLISGLISADKGSINVDKKAILTSDENWKRKIGYISQTTHLFDDSIKNNILFGSEEINKINFNRVLKFAQLNKFLSSLSNGINYYVGEDGKNLSGGQKQRISIARGLYNSPEVLICDEITSALDVKNTNNILKILRSLKEKMTIILITHNTKIISYADKVFYFKKNKDAEVILSEK
jgi:ABC-type multidrug transport system fused ATPase/permease subunit